MLFFHKLSSISCIVFGAFLSVIFLKFFASIKFFGFSISLVTFGAFNCFGFFSLEAILLEELELMIFSFSLFVSDSDADYIEEIDL